MKVLIPAVLALLLAGCDERSLVKTTISFAYKCQRDKLSEQECKNRANHVIDDD
jgi:hypothetical protein